MAMYYCIILCKKCYLLVTWVNKLMYVLYCYCQITRICHYLSNLLGRDEMRCVYEVYMCVRTRKLLNIVE